MYRKKSRGWYKHKDFILIDLACLFMALILAYLIRNGSVRNLFTLGIYRNVMIFVILVDLFLIILFESYKGVLRRGRYQELRSVIRQMILIELASGLYLFTVSGGHTFSRVILYLMGIFYVLLSYCTRIIWKKRLLHKMAEGGEHSLYIVTNYDLASKVIQSVKEHNYNRYNINGLILIDKDMTGKEIAGVQVVADLNNAPSFICQQWVDEVFVNVDETYPYPQELIEELLEMGMPVHVNLAKVRSTPGQKQFVEAIGGYTVLTTTMNYATDRQALAKRVLDILGGLVGCFLTGIIFIFIAPAIYISSPGPIFFSQTRIGKNGKPFKMYKFRSMYMDAEERKAELMAQNKMSDGRMFKLDFDPRVIGNKILPDGTRKTGIGDFIRKTSLDEFPQFWNVLNGTMSLVGTRPILQDELRQYELHHRARIAIKPGITGMWQVSGRSDITDFAKLLDYHWELSKKIDAGSSNTLIEQIFGSIEELVDGKLVCGAGGGGFLQVILKKGVTRQMVEERLKEVFIFQIGHKIGAAVLDIGDCLIHPGSPGRFLHVKPRQKALNDRHFFFKACFFERIEGCTFCLDRFFQTEETVDIQDTLHSRLAVIQVFPFRDCIHQVPAYMCPTGSTFCIRHFVVPAIPIAHQVAFESLQEFNRVIPGAGFRVFIEDDWYTAIFPAAEKPHIGFRLGPAPRFMQYLQGRFVCHCEFPLQQFPAEVFIHRTKECI